MPESSQSQINNPTPIRRLRVFLCHSSADKPIVRALYKRLLAEGADPWLDEENLLPGQNWELEIRKAVRNSDIVIVCLSSSSINKAGFVQKEITFVLDVADQQPEGTIFLIPLKLEKCSSPDRLSRWHWVNFFEERGYEGLMRSLRARAVELGIILMPNSATLLEKSALLPGELTASTSQEPILLQALDLTGTSELLPENYWQVLPNPFINNMGAFEITNGHISGRRTDIARIVVSGPRAFIILGAPSLGKSTLIHYLQSSPQPAWSWRDELGDLQGQLNLSDIHFVPIDLAPLEGIEEPNELLALFINQCMRALSHAFLQDEQLSSPNSDLKALRGLLRSISRETPDARYFVMLDSIERLGMTSKQPRLLDGSKAQTFQERGLALLDHCNAIRTVVDLIDEFTTVGVILSVESLPRPRIDDQFQHVSLDLARFTTMILQAFTWDDTTAFLAQEPENFGANWASIFKTLGGNDIFSRSEQAWLLQQAGTHPYLLQQLCFHMFRFKQEHASIHSTWLNCKQEKSSSLSN
jgi:hypothetical protein